MARLLLISNGHGEDISGAVLGSGLKEFGHQVDSLPIVGRGHAYLDAGIPIIGSPQQFSTGGIGYTSLSGRITELIEGQLWYLITRIFRLLRIAYKYDLLIAIGDIVPVAAAWLARKPVVSYLVAYSSHYEGHLKLPWPCSSLLSSNHFLSIYTRDEFTARDLTLQLGRDVEFLGNPFMEKLLESSISLPTHDNRIGILPGSRRPELDHNLELILRTIEFLPEKLCEAGDISLDMALIPRLDTSSLQRVAIKSGWILRIDFNSPNFSQLVKGGYTINVHRNSFSDVLRSSDILLSMAGTAAEQSVGLSKPVVQLVGKGPQFTPAFAEAQRRLLGPTVFCASGEPGEISCLRDTAQLTLDLLARLKFDSNLQRACRINADNRLGDFSGGRRIVDSINQLLTEL